MESFIVLFAKTFHISTVLVQETMWSLNTFRTCSHTPVLIVRWCSPPRATFLFIDQGSTSIRRKNKNLVFINTNNVNDSDKLLIFEINEHKYSILLCNSNHSFHKEFQLERSISQTSLNNSYFSFRHF